MLGSANMDLVVTVDHAPGPGETVTGRSFHSGPGGKGANQALAAALAGAEVRFAGAVGADAYGERIRSTLASAGVDVSALETVAGPTGTAHITVDRSGGNAIIVVPGANGAVRSLTGRHREAIAAADVLLLQLELPMSVVVEAARFARAEGVSTVLTPSPVAPVSDDLLDATDMLAVNQHEAQAMTGLSDPVAAAQSLTGEKRHVLLTLGSAGVQYLRPDAAPAVVPAFTVDAVDTTAAGDTFLGAF